MIGTQHYTLPMDTTVAPFDNNDVRTALKYAIDREEIFDKVLRGHGLVGSDQPIDPASRRAAPAGGDVHSPAGNGARSRAEPIRSPPHRLDRGLHADHGRPPAGHRQAAMLVRGVDEHRHFETDHPPHEEASPEALAAWERSVVAMTAATIYEGSDVKPLAYR